MKTGDKYICNKDGRTAVIVGCNDRYVEYRFEKVLVKQGKGIRNKTKPNVMCTEVERFLETFKVEST